MRDHRWNWVLITVVGTRLLTAQTADTGALTGTVVDPAGAAVSDVTVVVINTGSGQERTVITRADGSFTAGLLFPGTYKVRFSATGFRTAEVGPVTVTVTETPELNRTLEIGSQTKQVTVEANAEAVQTTNATIGAAVASRTITDLPLNTRNSTNLLALSAGVNSTVNNATAIGKGPRTLRSTDRAMPRTVFHGRHLHPKLWRPGHYP